MFEVGVFQKRQGGDQRSFGQDKAPPQKRRAVTRVESAETQDYVSAPPLTSCMEQTMETEDEEEMEELSFVPSAVSEPRWSLQRCDNKCREKGFTFFQVAAVVSQEGGAAHTINLCKQCYNERRLKQDEEEVAA